MLSFFVLFCFFSFCWKLLCGPAISTEFRILSVFFQLIFFDSVFKSGPYSCNFGAIKDLSGLWSRSIFLNLTPPLCAIVQNSLILQYLIIHFPTSSEVSEGVTKQTNVHSARVRRAVCGKWMSEQVSEQTSEWLITYIWIFGCSEP